VYGFEVIIRMLSQIRYYTREAIDDRYYVPPLSVQTKRDCGGKVD